MAKVTEHPDILVLGEHPAAYLAAALLKLKSKLRVVHCCIPEERTVERLVLVNPKLFTLHELLKPLERKLECKQVYGAQFLADEPPTRSEHRSKASLGAVMSYKEIRDGIKAIAAKQEVEFANPKQLRINRLDERGLEVAVGSDLIHPKALVLAGKLAADQEKMIGLPDAWEAGVLHRYTFVKLKTTKATDMGNRALVPMSLDLGGKMRWAWMLPGPKTVQIAVEQPVVQSTVRPADLLEHWVTVLRRHGVLEADTRVSVEHIESMDLPFAGALAHEGVANRTLLVGPAGGFYAATGEDIYPNCWSAIFAADVLKKALKEPHLQDALQPYRYRWRTTLGEHLRGPQQNLRFLLPLVYRNQVMATRLAEAILLGKSVVRQ